MRTALPYNLWVRQEFKSDMESVTLAKLKTNSLADQVYETLLEKIFGGHFGPGQRLHVDKIARDLGISSTPVRDALGRLEGDGLIHRRQYQGSFVRHFTEKEIRDLYEFRAGIEGYSARLASGRITEAQLNGLRQAQRVGTKAIEEGDRRTYLKYNQDFHKRIIEASQNAQLINVAKMNELQFKLLSSQSAQVEGASRRALKEHEKILDYLAMGNADAVENLVVEHVLHALHDIETLPNRE